MTIRDIIDLLESQGEWVNRSRTRDRILFGDDQTEISKVITCWVATNKVIQYAVEHDIHFIISHDYHTTIRSQKQVEDYAVTKGTFSTCLLI